MTTTMLTTFIHSDSGREAGGPPGPAWSLSPMGHGVLERQAPPPLGHHATATRAPPRACPLTPLHPLHPTDNAAPAGGRGRPLWPGGRPWVARLGGSICTTAQHGATRPPRRRPRMAAAAAAAAGQRRFNDLGAAASGTGGALGGRSGGEDGTTRPTVHAGPAKHVQG